MGASPTKVKDREDLPESPRKNSPPLGNGDGTGKKLDSKSKKQHIKMVDLLELSNLLGQPMERIDYISTALERRGVYLEKGILGEGGSGYILKAFNDREEKLAVKFVRCENAEQVKQSVMEYKILRQFNCDYITKVKELLQVERETETYHIIVMERCACDLKQFLRDVKENNSVLSKKFVLEICIQLIQGLDVLHQKNIIHLDIKPANILYGYDKKWKYADLGVSKTLSNERQHTTHLSGFTACYSSPEQFQMMSYNAKRDITKSSDIYSLGIVFLELTGMELNKKWLLQLKLQKPKGSSSNFNPEFQELNERIILPMIAYEPSERIELIDALQILNGLLDNEIKGVVAKQSLSPRKRSPNKHASVHRARDDPNDIAVLQVLEKDDRQQQQQQQQQYLPKVSSQQSLMIVENLDQPDQQSSSIPSQLQEQQFSQHQQQLQQQFLQQQQPQQQQQYIPPQQQQQPYRVQSLSSHQFLPVPSPLSPKQNKVKKYTEPSNQQDNMNMNNNQMPNINDSPLIYSHRASRMRFPTKYESIDNNSNNNNNLNGKQKIIKLQMASDLQKYTAQPKILPPLQPMQQSLHIPSQEMSSRQHLYNEVTPTLLQHLPTQDYNNNYNYNFSNALQQANNQFNNNNNIINNNSNNYTPMYQSNLLNQNSNSNSSNALQQLVLNSLQQQQQQQQQQPYYSNMQSPRGTNNNNSNNFSGAVNNQNLISSNNGGMRVPSPDQKKQKDSQNHDQLNAFMNRRHQRLGSLPLNFEAFKSNQGGQQQQQQQQLQQQQPQLQQRMSVAGGFASNRQPSPQNSGLEALAANPVQNGSQQYQQYLQPINNNSSQVKLPSISPLKKRSLHVSPSEVFQQQPQQYIFLKEKKSISPFDFFPEQI